MSPRKKATPRVREERATYAVEAPAPQSAEHARRIMDDQHATYVSERDWEILVDLMDNPPPPNEALIQALQHHRDFVRSYDRADEDG